MARKKAEHPYRALAVSLGVTLAMLTAGVYGLETLSWSAAGGRLIGPLLRLLGFILVGLIAGQVIEALGWTRALAIAARPIFRFGRLGHRCGAAFMADLPTRCEVFRNQEELSGIRVQKDLKTVLRGAEALILADIAHIAGLVAADLHPSPVPHCQFVTTTTHKTLRGPRGGLVLCTEEWAERIDKAVFPGVQGGPLMHTIAAKAVALREAQSASFVSYATQVVANARALAEGLLELGWNLVSGGTDTHLLLVDVRETKEYDLEHIAGALLMPLSSLEADLFPAVTDKPLVLHCAIGKRSAAAARMLSTGDAAGAEEAHEHVPQGERAGGGQRLVPRLAV